MFETAELGREVSKEEYKAEVTTLRPSLLLAQQQLRKSKVPVVLVVCGVDGAGKGELVHRLNEWLDPRGIDTCSFWTTSEAERQRPPYWRFWRQLPARGRLAIFYWGWYNDPILDKASGELSSGKFDSELRRIIALERMLTDDKTLLLKFWLHLPKKVQEERLKRSLRKGAVSSNTSKKDRQSRYSKLLHTADRAIRQTDQSHAPWHIIEATDSRHRDLAVARILLQTIEKPTVTDQPANPSEPKSTGKRSTAAKPRPPHLSILDRVDLNSRLPRKEYGKSLRKLQGQLEKLAWKSYHRKTPVVMLFEGWDAAGKGGAIRRVTEAIDARLFRVIPVAAPTQEELDHHYLWRFWQKIPEAGRVTIFDRSWYGRVLVERVENYATPDEWKRAYAEINDFELQLSEFGIVLIKFWIHIGKEEQLSRFQEREKIEYKTYKITDEDWRNRDRWADYELAVNEMVARTSTGHAPWTLVAGNDKKWARIQVLNTVIERIRKAL